ncbi:MAG: hypothetical protein CL840_13665 [Crocinitomicaceae bacterium]|nr:hypothetical protein [Crocinitomicaceae bacterium]|tara:strand:- start:689 stop:3937 length:3249 start_codon:yes stop_codon:yes gene_type:complete
MRNVAALLLSALFIVSTYSIQAQKYKSMMDDYSVNFYDVVKEAEAYFATHNKGKGSGYKGYQRWKAENEGKFGPSGDRSTVSHSFVENAWKGIVKEQYQYGSRAGQNKWEDLGPYDANNITKHYSQGIGRVETIFVDPNDDKKMYLGSRSGGFWRTADGGKNWLNSTDTMVATGVNTLSASVTNSDSVIIGLRNANNGYSQGVYYSTNGGMSWTESEFNPTNLGWGGLGKTGKVNVVAISPFNSKVVFIASDKGLYKSTDFLKTYTRVKTGNFTEFEYHPTNPNIVYAYDRNSANRNYIFYSNNGGTSFTRSSAIPGNSNNTTVRFSVSKNCTGCLYVASNNGVWKSIDEGKTFTFLSNPNTGAQGFAVSDVDTNKMIYGYVDLVASSNAGKNFTQRTWWSTGNGNHTGSSYIHADLRAAAAVNGVFYVGTDGYMCKSSDGGISWEILSDGTAVREFYRFGLSQTKAQVSMAGSQDNGTSIHKSTGWIEWNGGDGMEAIVHTINDDWMLGCWQYGNRQRTKDGGLTRHSAAHATGNDWIAPVFFDPNHHMRIFSFGSVVYKSETFGRNWQVVGQPNIGVIKHATIAENNSDIMLVVRNNRMAISYNEGVNWTDLTSSLPHTGYISDLAFDPNDDSTVVLTYDSYQGNNRRIYISNDLCKTWKNISFNLSPMPLRTVVIGHTKESYIYVGGEIGVYYMPMNGSSWTLYSDDLPNVSVRELDIQWATNTLRAVTWGRGMFEVKLVDKESYPSIVDIEMTEKPTDNQPVEDFPIHVTAEVEYSGTIKEVYLMWSKDAATLGTKIPMSLVSGKQYKTDTPIPNYPSGTEMYFKVFAEGSSNDVTESYKLNYSYRTCFARPTVTATATPNQLCRGDMFTLSASGALTYEWDKGAQSGTPIVAQNTDRYTVTGRDVNHCAGTDIVLVTVDTVVVDLTNDRATLEAVETSATYQWLDCDANMTPIVAANGKTYTSSQGGSFAVEITKNNCVDTSACQTLDPNGIASFAHGQLMIYPNPTDGQLLVEFEEESFEVTIQAFDMGGKLMKEVYLEKGKRISVDLSSLENGIYILEVATSKGKSSHRITKTGK